MYATQKLIRILLPLLFCFTILNGCTKKEACEDYKNQLDSLKSINWYSTDFTENNLGIHFGNVSSTIFYPKPFRQGSIEISNDMIKFTPTNYFKVGHKIENIKIIKHCSGKLILKFEDGSTFSYYKKNRESAGCAAEPGRSFKWE